MQLLSLVVLISHALAELIVSIESHLLVRLILQLVKGRRVRLIVVVPGLRIERALVRCQLDFRPAHFVVNASVFQPKLLLRRLKVLHVAGTRLLESVLLRVALDFGVAVAVVEAAGTAQVLKLALDVLLARLHALLSELLLCCDLNARRLR